MSTTKETKGKGKQGKSMGYNEVKFRKFYDINPSDRIHRTGKTDGYNRNIQKRNWQDEMEDEEDEDIDQD